jgi:diguanylate cyclase (GGDEF)-like protein/PAS domain S-box-containing protein
MSQAHRSGKARLPDRAVATIDPHSHESTAAVVARLTALVEAQAQVIRDYEARARAHEIFERASAAARLGIWECDLTTERLQWSGGTYDMFGIARDTPLVRKQSLICYPEHSLKQLEAVRSKALAEGKDFNLESEIVTPNGERRWIRITAAVECGGKRALRLFGLKQDITEEKTERDRLRYLAEFDGLTGLANRTAFEAALATFCRSADSSGALLVVDLDGFKDVNDTLGHAAGDECLKEAARRLAQVCGHAILTARVGGDEFAILLGPPGPKVPSVPGVAARIIRAMGRPIDCAGRSFRIGASVGIAYADACLPHELVRRADMALYAAKAGGRNVFRVFDPRLALPSSGGRFGAFR